MTTKFQPRLARTILAVSIAAIGTAAWAEDDEIRELITPTSTVEIGAGWVSDDSFKFGDYTGLNRSGAHLIGNVELNRRFNDGPGYFMLNARDLGLNSRSLNIETGEQGNYGLRLSYDEIPKLFSDSYQTLFTNPGNTNLTLPADFVRGANTAAMPTLNASMRPFSVASKRESLGLGFGKQLPKGWDVDLRVKREHKDGNRFTAAVVGNSGGNPRATIVPEPVNYTTDEIEALARYTDKQLQLQFGYYGSFFRNQNSSLTWANPFASSVWVSPATPGVTAYDNGSLSLPPDNQFHQVSASAGYTLTKDTRLSGSFALGRMLQNDAFLPYTVNPALAATATPLPRSSLDGRIDTTHLDMKIASKLMPKLNFHALYRYDERDNKTPQAQYAYIGGDSQSQAAAGLGKVRTNLPGSSTKQQIDAEFDYHYSTSTTFKLGYDYEWAKKTFEAIKDEREHTIKADVHQHFNDMVSGGFGYAYSDRKTSEYDASAPFIAGFSPAYVTSQINAALPLNGLWDNVPAQKKFFMAPRKRDKVKAFLNVTPTESIDLHMDVDYKDDDYHASQYGLQRATGWAVNLDASFRATDALSGHVFTSVDRYSTGQRSIALGGNRANVSNPDLDWTAGIVDRTVSFGAGVRYAPARKYELGGDVVRANSTGSVTVWTAPTLAATNPALPLPDLKTSLRRVDLFGTYKLQKDVSIKVKYIFERFSSADWAIDQVAPATMANVIGTNEVSPNYNVHFVGVSLAYQF
jgi:MtrB/PioB family decaheme-associated outer membrane protein